MKASSILCSCVLALATALAHADQADEIGSGMAGLGNGISVRIVTRAEPPVKEGEALRLSNRYTVGSGVLHRSVVDATNHTYFGYDLSAEPVSGSTQCRVAILPLTSVQMDNSSRASARGSASATAGGAISASMDSSWKPVLLPQYPDPQLVSTGDIIALDVLTNAGGQQKIVDYIDVSCRKPNPAAESHAARDLSLEDVEMHVSDPSLSINGAHISGAARRADARGSFTWFCFPGKGRFILSLTPRPSQGFIQAGTIKGDVISFRSGSDQYQVKSAGAILDEGRTWNVYVLHDPSFEPKSGSIFGGSMRLEELISKH